MYEQVALWNIDETLTDYKAIKSTDWKWNMATDYPEKNGLTAFSCFACGGGVNTQKHNKITPLSGNRPFSAGK